MRIIVGLCLVSFLFASAPYAHAKTWFVIKDSQGICRTIEAKDKTPKSIGGPYKSEAEADKAKEKLCAQASGAKWYIIKDSNDICRVIEADDRTPKTIAGPFNSQADAEKAKEKACKKKEK